MLLVQGTYRENVLLHPEINGVTIDGQGKATISGLDARQPAVQVLGREVIIKGFTVTGGFFGIAVNRPEPRSWRGGVSRRVALTREFEAALRRNRKPIEAHYYDMMCTRIGPSARQRRCHT